jgi:hypothetical protein
MSTTGAAASETVRTAHAAALAPSLSELRTLRIAIVAGRLIRSRGGFWTPLDGLDPSLKLDEATLRSPARVVASCFARRWLRPVPTERLPLLEATPAGIGAVLVTFDEAVLAVVDASCAIPPEQCRMLGAAVQVGVLRRTAADGWVPDGAARTAGVTATAPVTDAIIGAAREQSWVEPFDVDGRTMVLMPAGYRAATLAASRGAAFTLAAEARSPAMRRAAAVRSAAVPTAASEADAQSLASIDAR